MMPFSSTTPALDPGMSCQAPSLSDEALRRYAWMRLFTLVAVTLGVVLSIHHGKDWLDVGFLVILLAAYACLVRYQYADRSSGLRLPPPTYLALSALLVFGMMVVPAAATDGQSFWYCIMFFVVIGEARHLRTVRALTVLFLVCVALVLAAVVLGSAHGNWEGASIGFLPLFVGLGASAAGTRFQRTQELEHAARLATLEELTRSKAELEEANHQLQVYAGLVEQLAVANERTRLARDLHDILGYTLATVVVKAEAAKRLLGSDEARARDELDHVQEVARSGLAEVRRSVSGLRDTAVTPGVWHEALARFVEQFGSQVGLIVSQHIEPLPEDHDSALQLTLFRTVQEALTNVARHARAQHVSVALTVRGEGLELVITDDGVGVVPGDSVDGFGLRGMRERVEALGGQLLFSSRPGEGATVRVILPLHGITPGVAEACRFAVEREAQQAGEPINYEVGS